MHPMPCEPLNARAEVAKSSYLELTLPGMQYQSASRKQQAVATERRQGHDFVSLEIAHQKPGAQVGTDARQHAGKQNYIQENAP